MTTTTSRNHPKCSWRGTSLSTIRLHQTLVAVNFQRTLNRPPNHLDIDRPCRVMWSASVRRNQVLYLRVCWGAVMSLCSRYINIHGEWKEIHTLDTFKHACSSILFPVRIFTRRHKVCKCCDVKLKKVWTPKSGSGMLASWSVGGWLNMPLRFAMPKCP